MVAFRITLVAIAIAFAKAFPDCIHDAPDLRSERVRLLDNGLVSQSYSHATNTAPGARLFEPSNAEPVRIVFDFTGLTQNGAYCAQYGDTIPNYRVAGETLQCGQFDVITQEKINILRTKYLEPAVARVRQFVKVEPITGNLQVPSSSGVCGDTPIPTAHKSNGVANADLIVYLSAARLGGFTFAFSSPCRWDQNQRVVIAKMNVDPGKMFWSATDATQNEQKQRVIVHDLFHLLGVSSVEMFRGSNKNIVFKRGKQVAMSVLPGVQQFVRSYTGCSTLEGAEFEDETDHYGESQPSLSSASHWERRVWHDDIMTAYYDEKISGLTLTFLNDINVGYSTNPAAAEPMYWGRGMGCGVHNNLCNTESGGLGRLFCPDVSDYSSTCTYDFGGIGYCATERYLDGCTLIQPYGNRHCDEEGPETDDDLKYPYTFATDSRCLDTIGVHRTDLQPYAATNAEPRCIQSRCAGGKVQFKVPNSGTYATCDYEGQRVATPGTAYNGDVVCPDPVAFCRSFGIEVSAPTPQTPAPPQSAAPPQTGAPPPTSTPPTASPATPPASPSTPTSPAFTPQPPAVPPASTPQPPAAPPGAQPVTPQPSAPQPSTHQPPGPAPPLTPPATSNHPGNPPPPQPTSGSPSSTTSAPQPQGPVNTPVPAPNSPTPSDQAPPSTQPPGVAQNFTVVASVVIRGDLFATLSMYPDAWSAVEEAVAFDLGEALNVDASRIRIFSLRVGSLICNFTVDTTTQADAVKISTSLRGLTGSSASLPRTTRTYQTADPAADDLTIVSTAAAFAGDDNADTNSDLSSALEVKTTIVAAAVMALFVFLGLSSP
jgi:hypothetical protein